MIADKPSLQRLATVGALLLVLVAGCARSADLRTAGATHGAGPTVSSTTLPAGVISAVSACSEVVKGQPDGFFTDVEEVHLVLTTYANGEPVESEGDVNRAMPPDTPVWVVEVHAKAINWNHSRPALPPGTPLSVQKAPTDFSVVMNARTGTTTRFRRV